MINVDDANTINMKLFPIHRHPPPIKPWHVPISKIKFAEIVDDTWDLTMRKVIKHIDGIKDVRRIAHDANVAMDLTKIALQHLLYYDRRAGRRGHAAAGGFRGDRRVRVSDHVGRVAR